MSLFWKTVIRARHFLDRNPGVQIGGGVPDFSLSDLKGREYSLYSYFPRKAVALWFTNLCETCQEKIDFLDEAYQARRERLEVLAISTLGADKSLPEKISRDRRFGFPLLLDPEDWLGKKLGFAHPNGACPMYNFLILDRRGKISFKHHLSAVSDKDFFNALKSAL